MKRIFLRNDNGKQQSVLDYARGAVAELTRQLSSAQTDSRRTKLTGRIAYWNDVLAGKKEPTAISKAA